MEIIALAANLIPQTTETSESMAKSWWILIFTIPLQKICSSSVSKEINRQQTGIVFVSVGFQWSSGLGLSL